MMLLKFGFFRFLLHHSNALCTCVTKLLTRVLYLWNVNLLCSLNCYVEKGDFDQHLEYTARGGVTDDLYKYDDLVTVFVVILM